MNEFQLYEQLCILENITAQYCYGEETKDKIHNLANDISTRIYRVAVIGEFKRGKSSLINALIGSKVLPTDILPMTASVTRVKYGENKKITVYYKSGVQEEKTIDELINYATKFDTEKEFLTGTIKEVEVTFPSVLCKNNIEFLDTPGMNDDEKMSEITLGVLGDVDAAIMVISAASPLSLTEQDLIIRMIEKRGIRHIVFVVTHIDSVSDETDEQDKILNIIKHRISTDLLSRSENAFRDDEYLLKKSQRILSHPEIFGVSSVWAMEGFVADDKKKLKLSRLPDFKQELLNILTAAQSVSAKEKVLDAICDVENGIKLWYTSEYTELGFRKQELIKLQNEYKLYFEQSQNMLINFLAEVDYKLHNTGLFERNSPYINAFLKRIKRVFIDNLSQITEHTNTNEHIYNALKSSFSAIDEIVEEFNRTATNELYEELQNLYENYSKMRPYYPEDSTERILPFALSLKVYLKYREISFPKMRIDNNILNSTNFVGVNLIEIIESKIESAMDDYCKNIEDYIAKWRVMYLQYNAVLFKKDYILKTITDKISEIDLRKSFMKVNLNNDLKKIQVSHKLLNGEQ